jgi:hypothetical protein
MQRLPNPIPLIRVHVISQHDVEVVESSVQVVHLGGVCVEDEMVEEEGG